MSPQACRQSSVKVSSSLGPPLTQERGASESLTPGAVLLRLHFAMDASELLWLWPWFWGSCPWSTTWLSL